MRTSARGCWLAAGLLFGCGSSPSEVIGPYDGSGGSSGQATENGVSSGELATGSTGPVADGSASSGTGMPSDGSGTTAPVDPVTTDPGTSTSVDPSETTGPATSDPGSSSSGDPPPPPPTCQEIFGTATGYTPCMEDETSCTFSVNPQGGDCNAVCGMFGATCLDSIDNPGGGQECVYQGDLECDTVSGETSTICVCAK